MGDWEINNREGDGDGDGKVELSSNIYSNILSIQKRSRYAMSSHVLRLASPCECEWASGRVTSPDLSCT
jgi:hypothetical protein